MEKARETRDDSRPNCAQAGWFFKFTLSRKWRNNTVGTSATEEDGRVTAANASAWDDDGGG